MNIETVSLGVAILFLAIAVFSSNRTGEWRIDGLEQKVFNNAADLQMVYNDQNQIRRSITSLRQDLDQLDSTTGGLWRTAKGEVLQIRQMSDSHIENAIAYIDESGTCHEGSPDVVDLRKDFVREQKRRRYDLKMRKPIYIDIPLREFQERGGKVMAAESCHQPDDKTVEQAVKPLEAPECKIMPADKTITRFRHLLWGEHFFYENQEYVRVAITATAKHNAVKIDTGTLHTFGDMINVQIHKKVKIDWDRVDLVLKNWSRGWTQYQDASKTMARLLGRKI